MTLSTSRTQAHLEAENRLDSGVYNKHSIVLVRGLGARVWDEEGREYVDCVGGYGVANVGHSNAAVVKAVQEQAATLMICPQTLPNDKRAEFLTELTAVTPAGLDRVFLCNSGTEAMEAAVKFARAATGREKFVAMKRGFAGRTLGALGLTWEPKYREPFAPLINEAEFVAYNDPDALRAAVDDRTAAIVLEPVQGEGGVRPGDLEFIRLARELATRHGAMLVLDEIQTGFCRTGRMFALDHAGVVPDLMTLAKAMAGGVPVGAVVMTAAVADAMPKGGHGTTFGGNPLAMAAGIAAIRFMRSERLWERAAENGEYLMDRLRSIGSRKVKEVRGLGLMVGLELKERSAPYIHALEQDEAVLTLQATPTVIRYLPPLVIDRGDLDRAVDATAAVLERVEA